MCKRGGAQGGKFKNSKMSKMSKNTGGALISKPPLGPPLGPPWGPMGPPMGPPVGGVLL